MTGAKLRVALLLPGGVDRSGTHRVIPCILWMIERLAREVELHVFALKQEDRPGRWDLLGARVHNIGAPPRGLRMLRVVAAEHRASPFDVLHALWATPGAAAAVLGRRLGVPVLLHLDGGDLVRLPEIGFGLRNSWRGRLQLRVALAGASHVTTPSARSAADAARLGIRAQRLPYGVALDRWPAAPPRPRDPARSARLLHVGSLNRVKDHGTLLAAARLLVDEGVAFTLDLVGEDTLHGEAQRRASALDLEERCRFHGFLTHEQLRPFFDAADVHVVSSRHETGPVTLLEAAVAGVPTVGTAVGHLADWAPGAALAVAPGDAPALARAIRSLLDDERQRLAVAAAAQERALAEDADRTAERVLVLYEELLRPRRAST